MFFCRNSCPEVLCEKGFLRSFTKFTGKHLCQNLLFNKVADLNIQLLLKNRLWHRCFLVNFAKFLKTSFDRTPPDYCLLCLVYLRILSSFSEHLYYRAPMGNCSLYVQAAEFQPPGTVKNYFTNAFQAFYEKYEN